MSGPDADRSQAALPAKVGVYVCHCGHNIAAKVDVERVVAFAASLPGVSVARDYKFMCSDPGQELIQQDIRDGLVNRVVVASCSPLMHGATFRRATEAGGISPFYSQMASIREHVSWVTADQRGRDGEGECAHRRRGAARRRARAAGPAPRAGPPGRACRRRRDRGDPCGAHPRRRRQARLPGGARAVHRRPDGQVRQDLPDARLRGLHPHSEDGAGRPAPEHRPAVLQRGGAGLRLCGQLQGQGAQEGPLHQRGRLHRLQSLRRELHLGRDPVGVRLRPRHPPCRLQAVPAGRAGRSGHRPRGHLAVHLQLPGRRQGPRLRVTGQEGRVREGVRPRARRDARWSGAWAGPATRSARPSAPGRAWRARCRSGG